MSKSFRKFIAKPRNGHWELHPFDATPVWVPAKKRPAPRRERKYPRAVLEA